MKKTILTTASICILLVAITGCDPTSLTTQPTTESINETINQSTPTEITTEVSNNETEIEADPASELATDEPAIAEEATAEIATGNATYRNYDPALYATIDGSKPHAIFFHAPWCPTCVLLEQQIEANLADLPNSVTILKADYDSETELKARFGVTVQSTIVTVDSNGTPSEIIPFTSNFIQVADALVRNTQN